MLVRSKIDQAQTLRDLEVETYRDIPILLRKISVIASATVPLWSKSRAICKILETYLSSMKSKKYVLFS